jgi:hypothetical protein
MEHKAESIEHESSEMNDSQPENRSDLINFLKNIVMGSLKLLSL